MEQNEHSTQSNYSIAGTFKSLFAKIKLLELLAHTLLCGWWSVQYFFYGNVEKFCHSQSYDLIISYQFLYKCGIQTIFHI